MHHKYELRTSIKTQHTLLTTNYLSKFRFMHSIDAQRWLHTDVKIDECTSSFCEGEGEHNVYRRRRLIEGRETRRGSLFRLGIYL